MLFSRQKYLDMLIAHKFVRDDQLLILHDGKTYNIMGMEVK